MTLLSRFAQSGISVVRRRNGTAARAIKGLPDGFVLNQRCLYSTNQPFIIINAQGPAPLYAQLTVQRNYGTAHTEGESIIDGINKHAKQEEPRWFHRLPTERLENPAYTYLKTHPEYQKMFFQHEIASRLMTEDGRLTAEGELTVNSAVKAFIQLCNTNPEEPITDPKFEKIFSDLVEQSSLLTDIELLLFYYNLRRFPKRPRAKDKQYRKLWQPLDDLCFNRISEKKWSLEYMFNLADLMYNAGLATESRFHWELAKKLYRKVDHLSKEEFIRMMFCFGGLKSLPDTLSLYNVEYNLPKFIDELTVDEIAVVSVGFVRTKTYVNNSDVLQKMLEVVVQHVDRIEPTHVSAVAKAVNLSLKLKGSTLTECIYKFLDAFAAEVPRIDFHACASLMLLAVRAKVKHERLLQEIVTKIQGRISEVRTKDLEYICAGLATFNVECPEVYQEIIDDFQKRTDGVPMQTFCNSHGRSLMNILHYLTMRNIYPHNLLELALSDDFLGRTYGRSMYTFTPEVLLLDVCTGLEADGYVGPRLSEKFRGFLTKKNMLWIAADEKALSSEYQKIARFMLEVCINTLGGAEFCHLCNVVPPFRTIGAVYCLNEANQQPVAVPESFIEIDDFNTKYIPEEVRDAKIQFYAFVLFPGTQATVNGSEPMGLATMHCRQMEKLGYRVTPIYLGHNVSNGHEMKEFISKALNRPVPAEPKVID